jgi:hypothetical protein
MAPTTARAKKSGEDNEKGVVRLESFLREESNAIKSSRNPAVSGSP